jgi:UDP-GlcNAc:undecaprenyl-phosphate/decaprenyl-phosphate GlcNAc-1-phosphate transferase
MNLGHGHRRSVVILWTWTLLLSAFVLYPTLTGRNPTYLPFGIIALAIVLFTVLHPSVRARRRENGQPAVPSNSSAGDAGNLDDAGDAAGAA